jgi:hypothetical protein
MVYLHIYVTVFTDTVSSYGYIASNVRMTQKDLDFDTVRSKYNAGFCSGKSEIDQRTSQSRSPASQPRFELEYSRINVAVT